MKYNKEADKFLKNLYQKVGANTWERKFHTLELALGIYPGSSHFSHNLGWRSKTGCLEYEYLHRHDLIELELL